MSELTPISGLGKKYRRKLRHLGETWRPRQSKATQVELGLWCPPCNTRHGYRSRLLALTYEKRNGVWHVLWNCSRTGQMLKDQPLLGGSDG